MLFGYPQGRQQAVCIQLKFSICSRIQLWVDLVELLNCIHGDMILALEFNRPKADLLNSNSPIKWKRLWPAFTSQRLVC